MRHIRKKRKEQEGSGEMKDRARRGLQPDERQRTVCLLCMHKREVHREDRRCVEEGSRENDAKAKVRERGGLVILTYCEDTWACMMHGEALL